MRFAELDAVTVDGYGTLLTLVDPVPRLREALAGRGVNRSPDEIRYAFATEVGYYRPRAHLASTPTALAELRRECTSVFLRALDTPLPAVSFVDSFIAALEFGPVAGAVDALERLAHRGLRLAVVANWDCGLGEHLERAGLDRYFDAVVTSAEAGTPKPAPAIFRLALARLAAEPARSIHIGDEDVDRDGARAAGMLFAPAPLHTAVAGWT